MRNCMLTVAATISVLAPAPLGIFAQVAPPTPPPSALEIDFGRPCDDPREYLAFAPGQKMTPPQTSRERPLSQPLYPVESRRNGEEGRLVVEVLVNASGEVSRARVAKSTGYERLDKAGVEGTRVWRFTPPTVDGQPACMWRRLAVMYSLTDFNEAELSPIDPAPNARKVAQLYMTSLYIGQPNDGGSQPGALRTAIAREVRNAMAVRPEWAAAERELAALMTLDFSENELNDLASFLARPTGRKLIDQAHRHTLPLRSRQRQLTTTLGCVDNTLRNGMAGVAQVRLAEADFLKPQDADLIWAYVEKAAPYCECRRIVMQRRPSDPTKEVSDACGAIPAFEAPRESETAIEANRG